MRQTMLLLFYSVVFLLSAHSSLCHSSFRSKFSHYEILTPRHIAVRVKRDVNGRRTRQELTLSIFGRKVFLALQQGLPELVVSPNAKFEAIHANGTKSTIDLDLKDFHQGFIRGHPGSWVNAFHHDGLWTIQAVHPTMSFSVEPLGYHTGIHSNRYDMVAYRHEDIRVGKEKGRPHFDNRARSRDSNTSSGYHDFLGNKTLIDRMVSNRIHSKHVTAENDHKAGDRIAPDSFQHREKREVYSGEVCDILAIADYTFYEGIGGFSVIQTAKILINTFILANSIFEETKFEAKKTVGIHLMGITVYTHETAPLGFEETVKDNKRFIRLTRNESYFSEHCLVHISTQRYIERDALSSANTARPGDGMHGICGTHYAFSGNVGYTTMMYGNHLLPLSSYKLLVIHELGHNFGAIHDGVDGTSQEECTPSEQEGGKYLMWGQVLTGFNPNNHKFSPCSIRSMRKILKTRPNCLSPKEAIERNTCGNGVVDYGEDCDAGTLLPNRGAHQDDGCCTAKCRFSPSAICSPFNHHCCKNCTVAPTTERCVQEIDDYSCFEESFCDGVLFDSCPPSPAKPNGHRCANNGECQNGNCVDFCSLLGQRSLTSQQPLKRCDCPGDDHLCSICCTKSTEVGPCFVTDKYYGDATPCKFGLCHSGGCNQTGPLDADDSFTSRINLIMSQQDVLRQDNKRVLRFEIGIVVAMVIVFMGFTAFILSDSSINILTNQLVEE